MVTTGATYLPENIFSDAQWPWEKKEGHPFSLVEFKGEPLPKKREKGTPGQQSFFGTQLGRIPTRRRATLAQDQVHCAREASNLHLPTSGKLGDGTHVALVILEADGP